MRKLAPSSLIEALAVWGEHEAHGRCQQRLPTVSNDALGYADFTLRNRAPYAARLLFSRPTGAVLAAIDISDGPKLFTADGYHISEFLSKRASPTSIEYCTMLCNTEPFPSTPIISGMHMSMRGPLIIYDGYHRAAAWWYRCSQGNPTELRSYVIVCRRY